MPHLFWWSALRKIAPCIAPGNRMVFESKTREPVTHELARCTPTHNTWVMLQALSLPCYSRISYIIYVQRLARAIWRKSLTKKELEIYATVTFFISVFAICTKGHGTMRDKKDKVRWVLDFGWSKNVKERRKFLRNEHFFSWKKSNKERKNEKVRDKCVYFLEKKNQRMGK